MTFRFLVSLPLMLQIPKFTGNILRILLNQFVVSEIVQGEEKKKFQELVARAEHLKRSKVVSAVLWFGVYFLVTFVFLFYDTMRFESWRATGGDYTIAGWWLTYVSHPIYLFVFFSFLWRSAVWWWLVFSISKLKLNIRPAHGDNAGGIGFMAGTVPAFSYPAFAFSISFAAGAANLVLYENVSLDGLKFLIIGIAVILSILFIAPLLFFYPPLIKAKKAWILKYNLLSSNQVDDFERRWLNREQGTDALEANNFSALTDLNSTVERVSKMNAVPFSIKNLYVFILAIVIPFLPVIAMEISWKVLFKQILGLLHL